MTKPDAEMILIPRQTLIDLLVQLKMLRGCSIDVARRHSDMEVEQYVLEARRCRAISAET